MNEFKIKFGEVRSVLGIRVRRDRVKKTLTLDQETYALDMLNKLEMLQCKAMPTPTVEKCLSKQHGPKSESERREMTAVPYRDGVGSLMWLAGQTRPDLAFAVGVLARFMGDPGREHWENMKRVLRYVKGTADAKLVYTAKGDKGDGVCRVEAFCDADWASDVDGRRSTTGYVVLVNGNAVAWSSKKQPTVALSTAEAEYMAMSAVTEELCWLRQFLTELGLRVELPMLLQTDNQTAQKLSAGEASSQRTKHIDIRHHFIRDEVSKEVLEVKWIPTDEQLADMLTKSLGPARHKMLRRRALECDSDKDREREVGDWRIRNQKSKGSDWQASHWNMRR